MLIDYQSREKRLPFLVRAASLDRVTHPRKVVISSGYWDPRAGLSISRFSKKV